jgi:hypothetical protein
MVNRRTSLTVYVDATILQLFAKIAVERSGVASSFNDFVVQAIGQRLQQLSDSEIDVALARMAEDPEYRRDAVALAKEFKRSEWESASKRNRQ